VRCLSLWLSSDAVPRLAVCPPRRPILRLCFGSGAGVRLAIAAALSILALIFGVSSASAAPAAWPSGGHDVSNTHSQPAETRINPQNVVHLAPKWTFTTHGDVSAIPAVSGGAVYFPDWGGYLNKVDASTGKLVWQTQLDSYLSDLGITGSVSRAAPAIVGNTVYLGDQNGGHLFAVNATTGQLIWKAQVDSQPFAILTAGPLVINGVIYQGVASLEEGVAANGSYPCCIFRGSIVAVDAATGKTLWKTYMTPDNGGQPCTTQGDPSAKPPIPISGCGYSGASVWGTTPAYDPASNTLFVTTGNNYTVPDSVKTCESNGGTPGQCLSPDDHVDSILALNASTGQIKWATGTGKFDDWNVACIPGFGVPNSCPANPGPDYDFGSGPQLFTIKNKAGQSQLVVGAGEKSGEYWALDAATGKILWSNAAGPGSTLGGIEWGPATDGKRIYIAEANFNGIPYGPNNTTSGAWDAIDPATGQILWQTADPSHNAFGGGNALGPVSVADGVVFAPSMSGTMYALDANTGKILWSYQTPGAVIGGAAVVNGNVYWGDGYTHLGIPGWNGSKTFYDFTVNGN
jgi:polyvinyl alcohol dehydrogenase (cytochrome)